VVFVPALSGLGAPYWDPEARGLISGLTRGSRAGHIARATLEAIALQVGDLVSAAREDLASPTQATAAAGRICDGAVSVARIRVDGGAAENNLLMQFQSDISNLTIERPLDLESTARGAAMLAGVGKGVFGGVADAARMVEYPGRFEPSMTEHARCAHVERWQAAVARTRSSLVGPASRGTAAGRAESAGSGRHGD
jgi:glycerol kinase